MKKITIILILISILSCEEIINEQNITNDTISLLAPTENAALTTGTKISYNWEALNGATNYRLQITNPDFSNANQLVIDTLLTNTNFALDSLPQNTYQWRIKGSNSAFETAYTTINFIVEP